MAYVVRLAAGCFSLKSNRQVSLHRSAHAAIAAARKSNRLEAVGPDGTVLAHWVPGGTGIIRDGRTSGGGAGVFVRGALAANFGEGANPHLD